MDLQPEHYFSFSNNSVVSKSIYLHNNSFIDFVLVDTNDKPALLTYVFSTKFKITSLLFKSGFTNYFSFFYIPNNIFYFVIIL